MRQLRALNNFLAALLKPLCLLLVLVYSGVVILQVLARNYFLISVPWTDEAALILFGWSVFFGAALGVKSRKHYIVDLFPSEYVKTNTLMDFVANILVLGMVTVLFWGGYLFFEMGIVRKFLSIPLSQSWLYVSMPIATGCMLLFTLENLISDAVKLKALFQGGSRS